MINIKTSFDKIVIKKHFLLIFKIILVLIILGLLFGTSIIYKRLLNFDTNQLKMYVFYIFLLSMFVILIAIVECYIAYRIVLKKNIVFKITDSFIIQESTKGIIKLSREYKLKIIKNFLGLVIISGKEKIFISKYVKNYNKILVELNK